MTRLIARAGQDIVAKTESSDIHVADIGEHSLHTN